MRIGVFEDAGVHCLEPLTLTRPTFDLWCGSVPLLARHVRHFAASEIGAWVRPSLADVCRLLHPELAVNDPDWTRHESTVLVNARWLPPVAQPEPANDLDLPCVAFAGGQIAYAVLPAHTSGAFSPDELTARTSTLPRREAGGAMIGHPWDLVEHNAAALAADLAWRRVQPSSPQLTLVGPEERLVVDPSARIAPLVIADTTRGPIVIDRDVVVHSFTRLEGPCYIGPETHVLGAKLSASTIGPVCRIGGEVEQCIVQGYSNKCHDGFLGHSYVGEWVNLGAGTQVSDLRNDYRAVRVTLAGVERDTGLLKVGAVIGDHTKTGLNTLINTGSIIGAFCQLLPAESYQPRVIPSFCKVAHGELLERTDLDQMMATAAVVMQRRGRTLSSAQEMFFRALYEELAPDRRQTLRERQQSRLRQKSEGEAVR